MKIGSEAHKELLCRSFMDSHLAYEPATLPWPDLDSNAIERIRKIPFWDEALYTERKAGVMLKAYADRVDDPMMRAAIALQAAEEARHGRVIEYMINHYGIEVPERPEKPLPTNLEPAFIKFGYGECFDSFFAFGLFGIARQTDFIPEALFNIFNTLVDEEARHMVFFVNWIAHKQVVEGRALLRPYTSFRQYTGAALRRLDSFQGMSKKGKKSTNKKGFTASGAKAVKVDLSLETFLEMCISENEQRMSVYPAELLRPDFLPAIAAVALNTVKLLPRRKTSPIADPA
ncbi:MAG: ferritin-like domain-containing protein [Leptolyngbyaceae cyanobacterium bins.349]|nr:ferritin-like domain-containing protein [Leptolyngbyaceae cyanobacterium bins.349]